MGQIENANVGAYDLSVVIPVFNAKDHLEALIQAFAPVEDAGYRCQFVLIDDCSSDGSREEIARLADERRNVVPLYQEVNLGAGHARNVGFNKAMGRFTIFFDADDTIHTDAVLTAIRALDANETLDTVMFAYRYEREATASFTEMSLEDQKSFRVLLKGGHTAVGTPEEMARLLRFTNYPWNKVLRTDRFREVGLRFGSTHVNNDILGHWYSLMFAREIMIVNEVMCTHVVHPAGGNLTNQFSRKRLVMFDALAETYALLEAHPHLRRRFAHHFWGLTMTVCAWAKARISAEYKLEFDERYAALLGHIHIEDYARMKSGMAPDLADALAKQMLR